MNRPLLHAEALEGDEHCTCSSSTPCPMCGTLEASPYCEIHNGEYLAKRLAEDREPTDEEMDKAVAEMDLEYLLDDREPEDVLAHIRTTDRAAVLDWIEDEVGLFEKTHSPRYISAQDLVAKLPARAMLEWLVEEEKDLLRDWINENVVAELTRDDNGKKVPTLNIKGL